MRRAITGDPAEDPDHDWETDLRPTPFIENLLAERDGHPFAYLQIIDPAREPTGYWGTGLDDGQRAIDIWIGEATGLRRGDGTRAMRLAIARCFADQAVHRILVDPLPQNTAAQAFFRSLGFRPDGRRMLDHGITPADVHTLHRADWTPRD